RRPCGSAPGLPPRARRDRAGEVGGRDARTPPPPPPGRVGRRERRRAVQPAWTSWLVSFLSRFHETARLSTREWIPHSFFSRPRQRPARGSSPDRTRLVHGMQPMLG